MPGSAEYYKACFIYIVKFEHASESPGGCRALPSRVSDSVGLGCSLNICKFLGDAAAAVWGLCCKNHWHMVCSRSRSIVIDCLEDWKLIFNKS